MKPRSSARISALLGMSLLLATALMPASAVAAGHPRTPLLLRPSDTGGSLLAGPGYFQASARPGTTVRLFAFIGNKGRTTAGISVVPVDATSGQFGAVSYNLPEQPRTKVGAWVHLSRRWIQLRADTGTVVPFSVHVPRGLLPGQYIGALTAFVPAKPSSGRGIGITLQTRVFNAIVITVPGTARPRLTIASVGAQHRPDQWYVIVHVRNSGNLLVKGHGFLWVYAPWSKRPWIHRPLSIDTTVPSTTVHYPVAWGKQIPAAVYRFAVRVTWDSPGVFTKQGHSDFVVKHGAFRVH